MERYVFALAITIVVETLLACLLRWRLRKRLVLDVPLMNLLTHSLLHVGLGLRLPIASGEILVMAIEAGIYRGVTGLSLAWSLGLAVGLNALTWMLGQALVL